jgi:hypothetical protein
LEYIYINDGSSSQWVQPLNLSQVGATGATGSTPAIGGSSTQVQYNNAGALAGSANLTFNGTSLTLGGNPTLSAGTATGVVYLNGSKVATTGSALTFDASANFNFTGTGLYPVIAVYPTGNNAIFGFRIDASAGNGIDWRMEQGRSAVGDFNLSAPTVNPTPQYVILKNLSAQYWSIGSSEGMRLTTTGLGIGTNSPSNKLDVLASADWQGRFVGNSGYNGGLIVEGNVTGSRAQINLKTNSGTAREYYLRNVGGTFSVYDNTAGTIPLLIEAATPSNTLYINASGRVGIGTTSPGAKLDVYNGSSGVVLNLQGVDAYNAETGVTFSSSRAKISGFLNSSGGIPGTSLRFYTMPDGGSVTERLRIDSGGIIAAYNNIQFPNNYTGIHWATANSTDLYMDAIPGERTVRLRNWNTGSPNIDVTGMQAGTFLPTIGVKFPASQNASADANTLDDYEEGDWTPTLATNGFSAGATLSSATGRYTKVGRLVSVTARLTMSGFCYPSGYVLIGSLPFTVAFSGIGSYTGSHPGSGNMGGACAAFNTNIDASASASATTSTVWTYTVTFIV